MDRPVKTILWVDDDIYLVHPYILKLGDKGYDVITAGNCSDAMKAVESKDVAAVVMDIRLPPGEGVTDPSYKGGFESGLVLGRWLRNNYPLIPIVGFSAVRDAHVIEWFERHGAGYLSKFQTGTYDNVVDYIESVVEGKKHKKMFRVFLVHGHDNAAKEEVRNFIRDVLQLGEPIILNEQPSLNRTIIEKFEEVTEEVNLVFILLTPDDKGAASGTEPNYRSRQNVILELGYFLGKLGRRNGKILLLHKGDLELPSDLAGLIYIDISDGVNAAADEIRRELAI